MTTDRTRPTTRWVVFTDLDGTLLDARTYSAAPAQPALAALASRGVPVVFCSSKTAAEQRPIRRSLGLEPAPFIVENGSAVIVPQAAGVPAHDWPRLAGDPGERVHVLGLPAAEVRAGIARATTAAGVRVTGYADLCAREVAALTGLTEAEATRAQQRDYSETLIDELPARVWRDLDVTFAAEGLRCQHGGRFHTVTSAYADKGRATRVVMKMFGPTASEVIRTIGLGDSANDADLLAAVDRPFLIARHEGGWAPLDQPNLCRISRAGPEGWNEAILGVLAEVES